MFAVFLGGLAEAVVVKWRGNGLLAVVCDRALEVVNEGGSRLAGNRPHVPPSFTLASCDSKRQGQAHTIPLILQQTLSPLHSIHNAVHPCFQHAQAARYARLPRPAAREGSAPPGLS
jgi:hypothetical protein